MYTHMGCTLYLTLYLTPYLMPYLTPLMQSYEDREWEFLGCLEAFITSSGNEHFVILWAGCPETANKPHTTVNWDSYV